MKNLILIFLLIPTLLFANSKYSTVKTNPNGSKTARITQQPQNYFKDGEWIKIDTNIQVQSISQYTNVVDVADYTLRLNDANGIFKFDYSGKYTIFTPQDVNNVKANITGDKATYKDLWDSVDYELVTTEMGVKEYITIKNGNGRNSFQFRIDTDADIAFENERLSFDDGEYYCEKPYVLQNNELSMQAPPEITVIYKDNIYTVTADTSGATYPIVIDPTVTIKPDAAAGKDAYLLGYSVQCDHNLGTGLDLRVGEMNSVVNNYANACIQFDLSGIDSNVSVTAAVCSLVISADLATNTSKLYAHRIVVDWDEGTGNWEVTNDGATWNERKADTAWTTPGAWGTHTEVDSTLMGSVSRGANDAVGSPHVFSIVSLVQGWIDGTYTNHGMLLKTDDAIDNAYLYYSSDYVTDALKRASLTVTYYTVTSVTSNVSYVGETPQANVSYIGETKTANIKYIDETEW